MLVVINARILSIHSFVKTKPRFNQVQGAADTTRSQHFFLITESETSLRAHSLLSQRLHCRCDTGARFPLRRSDVPDGAIGVDLLTHNDFAFRKATVCSSICPE